MNTEQKVRLENVFAAMPKPRQKPIHERCIETIAAKVCKGAHGAAVWYEEDRLRREYNNLAASIGIAAANAEFKQRAGIEA